MCTTALTTYRITQRDPHINLAEKIRNITIVKSKRSGTEVRRIGKEARGQKRYANQGRVQSSAQNEVNEGPTGAGDNISEQDQNVSR